eukprot:5797699-Amphidinium_carterae.1
MATLVQHEIGMIEDWKFTPTASPQPILVHTWTDKRNSWLFPTRLTSWEQLFKLSGDRPVWGGMALLSTGNVEPEKER